MTTARKVNNTDDGVGVTWSFDLEEGDVDGDAALARCLHLVHDEGELERGLAHLLGLLLDLYIACCECKKI